MIDIQLTGNEIALLFKPEFFDPEFSKRLQTVSHEKYGTFNTGESLGFGERLRLKEKTVQAIRYAWTFPEPTPRECSCVTSLRDEPCSYCGDTKQIFRVDMREISMLLATLDRLFNFEIEFRFPDHEELASQSFDLCDMPLMGYGKAYPPLLDFLAAASASLLEEIATYVEAEMKRVYRYVWGLDTNYIDVTIKSDYFFFKVPGNGIWLDLGDRKTKGSRYFAGHNIEHEIDLFHCLIGLISLNTFFRAQTQ